MIAQPQDYKLVTPVGQIDGGILPARDVAADGTAHDLRTEDVCFLLEAGRRIMAYSFTDEWLQYGEPWHGLDREPICAAIGGIHKGAIINASYDVRTWPNAPVLKSGGGVLSGLGWRYVPNIVQYGTTGVADLWDGCLTSATASSTENFVASTSDFSYGRKSLLTDGLRKVFFDLGRVKGIVANGNVVFDSGSTRRYREWSHSGTLVSDNTRDYSMPSTTGGSVFSAERDSDSFYGPEQYDYSWDAEGIRNPTSHPERLAALTPTSCWALWRVDSSLRYLGSSSVDRYVDGYLVEATVEQTGTSPFNAGDVVFGVSVKPSDILSLCKQAHGLYDYVWDMPDLRKEEVAASCVGVMFYDSGVDFSALGWTWPTAN